ncbi:hypothetical protein N7519_004180 [Penicillium mononematosum]|uniref:uncharacterized protein n=1 Tax=Penicillium mononematosum TaxID=268346 RepID=UPI002548FFE5|nr:uncharacterized protein N7519_004180 [Penicillium mononematosum]KAJ6189272.1 hypothetical protein N7519_004180 [Penicillium mononematosum]
MGVPFEALLPYGIIITMFGVSGYGLHYVKRFANDGKKARWNRDLWDRQMMERDQRITGSFRGQSSNHQAPTGFDVSNPWKAETLTRGIDREPDLLVSKIATSFPLRSMSAPSLLRDHTYPLQFL